MPCSQRGLASPPTAHYRWAQHRPRGMGSEANSSLSSFQTSGFAHGTCSVHVYLTWTTRPTASAASCPRQYWLEPFSYCGEFNGEGQVSLSSLHRTEERQFWIGFNKRNPLNAGSWEWSDGTPVSLSDPEKRQWIQNRWPWSHLLDQANEPGNSDPISHDSDPSQKLHQTFMPEELFQECLGNLGQPASCEARQFCRSLSWKGSKSPERSSHHLPCEESPAKKPLFVRTKPGFLYPSLLLLLGSLVCECRTLIHATRKRASFILSPSKRTEMPVLKISPPQPERVIRKEKERLAFRQLHTYKSLCKGKGELTTMYFFGFKEECSHFSQEDREKKTEAVSQIEMGSIQGHRQNQVVRCTCEMGRLALAYSEHLLQLLFIELQPPSKFWAECSPACRVSFHPYNNSMQWGLKWLTSLTKIIHRRASTGTWVACLQSHNIIMFPSWQHTSS